MIIESVYLGEGWSKINLRVFARVDRKRFEFVRLTGDEQLEVYDFPKSWGGVSRFCGYAPRETAEQLYALAQDAAAKEHSFTPQHDLRGRTIEVQS